ncbi:MAG: hypothetical protein ABWX88_04970 [Pseudoxanthomonas sp.]
MYSRTGINEMLTELADDMPRLLSDAESFRGKFEDRCKQILAATAPADQAYAREVLEAFAKRCGIHDRHAA